MLASGKLLRGARLILGISQREMAKTTGIARATIDRLERGLSGSTRIREKVQKALEAEGIRFLEATEDSAGGVMLPPDPPPQATSKATRLD
jgi:transcriptional regulator with XRE-family HTH domain